MHNKVWGFTEILPKKTTNKPFKLPSIFLFSNFVKRMRETHVQEFVTMRHPKQGKPDFHNKNRVSTATERSHIQLSRFRVHFKKENFFRKRK